MPAKGRRTLHDVIVVGAGFAGLAAAMNAASDNANVLILEGNRESGGQGGSTNEIKNLFGFPGGISGPELTDRGVQHCAELGVELQLDKRVIKLEKHAEGPFTLICDDRTQYHARAVIAACGLTYRHLDVNGEHRYMGRGVGHGFPTINNVLWKNKKVGVVGAGNAGAQSCLFLSECEGCQVVFFVRGKSLSDSMSGMYLDEFVPGNIPNLEVCLDTVVEEILGDDSKFVGVQVRGPDGLRKVELDHLRILVGAQPHTAWLDGVALLDKNGFVLTDRDVPVEAWPSKDRQPRFCETNIPGLFAVGDVRQGNARRRAQSAINEGMQGAASAIEYLTPFGLMRKHPGPRLVKIA